MLSSLLTPQEDPNIADIFLQASGEDGLDNYLMAAGMPPVSSLLPNAAAAAAADHADPAAGPNAASAGEGDHASRRSGEDGHDIISALVGVCALYFDTYEERDPRIL